MGGARRIRGGTVTPWVPLLLIGVLIALPSTRSRDRLVPFDSDAGNTFSTARVEHRGIERDGRGRSAWVRAHLRREDILAAALGAGVSVTLGGVGGAALGVAGAAAVAWGTRRRARRVVPDDPLAVAAALDLFAACLRAGAANAHAARAAVEVCAPQAGDGARGGVHAAAGTAPKLGSALRGVADLLALGEDPAEAWIVLAGEPGLEPIARLARRSADSGASLAGEAGQLAESFRGGAADSAVASAERAGVAIAGPLGVCFLPAFICLGIAPVIVGLAGDILSGGVGM